MTRNNKETRPDPLLSLCALSLPLPPLGLSFPILSTDMGSFQEVTSPADPSLFAVLSAPRLSTQTDVTSLDERGTPPVPTYQTDERAFSPNGGRGPFSSSPSPMSTRHK